MDTIAISNSCCTVAPLFLMVPAKVCFCLDTIVCIFWSCCYKVISEPIKHKLLASSTSPEGNRSKKHEGSDVCVTCKGKTTDDNILECVWCEGIQHRSCTEINVQKYAALSDLSSNTVFFCTHCVYKLLMVYNKTKEACSVVEDTISTKFKTLQNNSFQQV